MTCFGRGLAGWWEVMRGECSSHFRSERGRRPAGPTGRPRPSGEGESGSVGEEGRWPQLGQISRNKILSYFIWNLNFWQTLEFCTRRFRRNFDMGIFSKIF
jgi:hypothetical protein